jgi:hypothetical protein
LALAPLLITNTSKNRMMMVASLLVISVSFVVEINKSRTSAEEWLLCFKESALAKTVRPRLIMSITDYSICEVDSRGKQSPLRRKGDAHPGASILVF